MSEERVRLYVNGQSFPDWLRYEVSSDMRRSVGTFTITSARPAPGRSVGVGGLVALKVGGVQVLRGRVQQTRSAEGRKRDELSITGEDSGGLLTRCSADPSWRFRRQLLSTIAQTVGSFAGLDRPPTVEADVTIDDHKVEPGQSCWSVLEELALAEGMRLWVAGDGSLTISPWLTYGQAVGKVIRSLSDPSRNNTLDAVVEETWDGYSEVLLLGEVDGGSGGGHLRGTWTDLSAPAARVGVFRVELQAAGEADSKAADIGRQASLYRRVLEYTVEGHTDAQGRPWALNTLVEVDDEYEGITGNHLVVARSFSSSSEGRRTTLTLIDPAGLTRA